MCSIRFTQKTSVLIAQCAHAHSNHVRNVALKRVVSVHNSFNLLTTTSGEFWEEYGCCLLRVQILLVGGVRRQLGEVGGCSGGRRRWWRRRLTSSAQRNEARDTLDRDASPSRSSVTVRRHDRAWRRAVMIECDGGRQDRVCCCCALFVVVDRDHLLYVAPDQNCMIAQFCMWQTILFVANHCSVV